MFKKSMYNNYEIATKRKLYDYSDMTEEEEDIFRENLYEEQMKIIDSQVKTKNVIIHILEDDYYLNEHFFYDKKEEICNYLEYLAIKDGTDLVKFENGNLGYIAYYSLAKNGFEIIETDMTMEDFERQYEEV